MSIVCRNPAHRSDLHVQERGSMKWECVHPECRTPRELAIESPHTGPPGWGRRLGTGHPFRPPGSRLSRAVSPVAFAFWSPYDR